MGGICCRWISGCGGTCRRWAEVVYGAEIDFYRKYWMPAGFCVQAVLEKLHLPALCKRQHLSAF